MELEFVREFDGQPGICVEYKVSHNRICSVEEWNVMRAKQLLLEGGASEVLLERYSKAIQESTKGFIWIPKSEDKL